jgi:hypothetical protein
MPRVGLLVGMQKSPREIRGTLLDIVSYGRQGPKGTVALSTAQIDEINRTVRRVPEVMVKVLPKDTNSLRAVARHLNYIGRYVNRFVDQMPPVQTEKETIANRIWSHLHSPGAPVRSQRIAKGP